MAGTHTTSRPAGIGDQTTPDSGGSTVGEMASRAQDAAGAAAGTIKEHGSELQKTAKAKAVEKADERRKLAADKARNVESDLRDLTGSVREKQPQVADALEKVLDRAHSFVDYVESTPVDEMANELGRQARRRPWMVAGGMFAAGFLLSRALKPVDGVMDSVTHGHGDTQGQLPMRTTGGMTGQYPHPSGGPVHV